MYAHVANKIGPNEINAMARIPIPNGYVSNSGFNHADIIPPSITVKKYDDHEMWCSMTSTKSINAWYLSNIFLF